VDEHERRAGLAGAAHEDAAAGAVDEAAAGFLRLTIRGAGIRLRRRRRRRFRFVGLDVARRQVDEPRARRGEPEQRQQPATATPAAAARAANALPSRERRRRKTAAPHGGDGNATGPTDNDEFARAFVRALGDWKYEPATRGTAKVPYHTVLTARFPPA